MKISLTILGTGKFFDNGNWINEIEDTVYPMYVFNVFQMYARHADFLAASVGQNFEMVIRFYYLLFISFFSYLPIVFAYFFIILVQLSCYRLVSSLFWYSVDLMWLFILESCN